MEDKGGWSIKLNFINNYERSQWPSRHPCWVTWVTYPPLFFLPCNSPRAVICHVQNLLFFPVPLVFGSPSSPISPLAWKWAECKYVVNTKGRDLGFEGKPGADQALAVSGHIVFLSAVKVRRCNEDKRQEPCGREVTPLSGRNPHWRLGPQGGQSGSLFSSSFPLPPYHPPSTWDQTS